MHMRTTPRLTTALAAAGLTLGLASSPAAAALVGVDYASTTQDVFTGTTDENVGSNNVGSASLTTSDIGDPTGGSAVVDVTVTEIDDDDDLEARGGNGDDNRTDLDPTVFPLANLGEDIINTRGGELEITISGLSAGEFTFTGVFNDSFTKNDGFATGSFFDILLTDANGTEATVASDVEATNVEANSDAGPIASETFDFTSNGMNDVSILLSETTSNTNGFIPLGGFTVTVIPEPASLSLLGLGGLMLLPRRRRR